jgi:DNA-binding response OmpR family regulator
MNEPSKGEEALDLLRSAAYEVNLLDIKMAGIGGIEKPRRIRPFVPRPPVLMLTVRNLEEANVEALDLIAVDYVTRPFSTHEVIALIRASVRRFKEPIRAEDA